jgi:hypothetical protein
LGFIFALMFLLFQKTKTYIWLGAGLFFSLLMLQITWPYFSFRYDVDFLLTKQNVLHVTIWRYAFYTHISSSLFVLLFGIFQFPGKILLDRPKLHRSLGKAYVLLVLLVSAPSGLIMAFYANGGLPAKASFAIISILWWYFTFMAYRCVLKRNFDRHQAFMYRSYALTLSAITLRTYVLVLPYFFHIKGKDLYVLVAWLSWIPNLIIAEWLIRRSTRISEVLRQ